MSEQTQEKKQQKNYENSIIKLKSSLSKLLFSITKHTS